MYEQDDRDIRAERVEQKLEPLKNVMLRCRLPGGIIQPQQWLVSMSLQPNDTSYGSIRLTNRQTFQFHGVLKQDIKPMHQWLNKLGLIHRHRRRCEPQCVVLPTLWNRLWYQEAYEWAKKISEHLLPRTRAYAEIWLDGEKSVLPKMA